MDELQSASEQLADVFLDFAQQVRVYLQGHWDELLDDERLDLQTRIDQFEDLHELFAADAIQEALTQVRPHIPDLQAKTEAAKQALKTVTRIADVTKIVTGVIAAAESAAQGDLGGTASALAKLGESLIPAAASPTAGTAKS